MKMSASTYIKDLNEAFDKYFENVSPIITEMCDQYIDLRRKNATRGLGEGGSREMENSLLAIIDELMFIKTEDDNKSVFIDQSLVTNFVKIIMTSKSILTIINNFNDQKIIFVNNQQISSSIDRVENEIVSLHRRVQKAITGVIENSIGIDNKSIYDQDKLLSIVGVKIFTSQGFGAFKKAVENNERKLMYSKIEDNKDLRKRVGEELKKLISKTNDDNQDFRPLVDDAFKGNVTDTSLALKKVIISTISNLKVYESEFHKFSEKIDVIFRESSMQSILKKVYLNASTVGKDTTYSLITGKGDDCNTNDIYKRVYQKAGIVTDANTAAEPLVISAINTNSLNELVGGIKGLIQEQYKDVSEFLKLIKDISEMDISPKMFVSLIFSIYYLNLFKIEDNKLGNLISLVKNLCETTLSAIYNVLNIFINPSQVVGNIVAVSGGANGLFTADDKQMFVPSEFKPQLRDVYLKAPYIIIAFADLSKSNSGKIEEFEKYEFLKFNTVKNSKWRDLYTYLCPSEGNVNEKPNASMVVNYINQIAEGFDNDNIANSMINDLISTYTISIRKTFEDTSSKYGDNVDEILADIQNNTQPNVVKRISDIISIYKSFITSLEKENTLEKLKQKSQVTKIINTYNFDINKARNNLERTSILQEYLTKDFNDYFDSNAKVFSSYATTVYALYYLLNVVCGYINADVEVKTDDKTGKEMKIVNPEINIKLTDEASNWMKAKDIINISMLLADGGNMMIDNTDTKNIVLNISFTPIYNKLKFFMQRIESIKQKFVFSTNLDINEDELNDEKVKYFSPIEKSIIDKIQELGKIKTIKIEKLSPYKIEDIKLTFKLKEPDETIELNKITDKRYAFKTKLNDVQKKIIETNINDKTPVGSIFTDYDLSAYLPYEYQTIPNSFMGEILKKFNKINDWLFESVDRLVVPIEFIESLKNNGFDFVIDPLAQSPFVFNSPSILYAAISDALIKLSQANTKTKLDTVNASYNPNPLSNKFETVSLKDDIQLITNQDQVIIPWIFKYTANALSVSNKVVISMMDSYSLNHHIENVLMVLELVTESIAMIDIIGGSSKNELIKQTLYPTKNSLSSFRSILSDYVRNILSDNNVVNKLFTDHIESMNDIDHYGSNIQKEYRWVAFIAKFIPNFDVDRLIEKIKVAIVDSLDMPKDALVESFKCMAELYNYAFEMNGGELNQIYTRYFDYSNAYRDVKDIKDKLFNVVNTAVAKVGDYAMYNESDTIYTYPKDTKDNAKSEFYKAFLKTLNINLAIPISILNETGFASILVLGANDKDNKINVCNFTTNVNDAFNKFISNLVNSRVNIKISGKDNNELVNAYNLIYNGDYLHGGSSEPDMMKVIAKVRKALAKEGLTLDDVIEAKPKFEELQNASANGIKQFIPIMISYFEDENINGQPSKDLIDLIKRVAHTKLDATLSTEQLIQLLAAVFIAYKDNNDSQKAIMKNFKLIRANKLSHKEIIDIINSINEKDIMIIICTDDDVADIW